MAAFVLLFATLGACGNYSNEDLEFMNAIPAAQDISVEIPRAMILPANEAELARLTHETITAFNGALDFLTAADVIRTYPPTSRIPNGRVWGPIAAEKAGWQWQFVVTRDPMTPEMFSYHFDMQRVGAATWTNLIDGWFLASSGARRGVGHFRMRTDPLRTEMQFPFDVNLKGEVLKELIVDYSTAAFPISVTMNLAIYTDVPLSGFTKPISIRIHYGAQESGQGVLEFSGTDTTTGYSISIVSHWLASGRGRADATVVTDGTGATGLTRTQCWNDSFVETYDLTEWDPTNPLLNGGDPADCPDISAL